MNNKVLIVDDERAIVDILKYNLEKNGMTAICAYDGGEGLRLARESDPDVILLDVMLPDIDGFTVTRRIRQEGINAPVLFLTARDDTQDKIMGLTLGADDYITKPFNPLELVARVKTQLRRYTQLGAMQIKETQIAIRGLVLDTESKSVTVDGEAVRLTPLEYKILELLCRHPGKVFSTEEIYRQVWNDDIVSDNAIAVHVRHIREKIEINPKEPRYLKVVWGVGYKIERSE